MDLEDQLRLKDSLARLGELTAGIAHEFRNGLATIHGYSRLLDLERLPPDFRPYVEGIRGETDALRQVVTNFLNFAKPAELALAPVALRGLAERAGEEIRAEARARGGSVSVDGEFGTVMGDEVLLRQALSNLCRNALEASLESDQPPTIRIEGAIDAIQRIQQITITDSGPGVDANVRSEEHTSELQSLAYLVCRLLLEKKKKKNIKVLKPKADQPPNKAHAPRPNPASYDQEYLDYHDATIYLSSVEFAATLLVRAAASN